MKKLAIVLTLISSVAFAQKSMIRFDVNGNADSDVSSFDLSFENTETETAASKPKTRESNVLINYAYEVAPHWQVGITLGQKGLDDGTNKGSVTTTGLSFYWNMEEDLSNTCYVGLHYNMFSSDITKGSVTNAGQSFAEDDEMTQIALEYGHRFNIGKLWGVNVTYSPAVVYSMNTFTDDNGKGTSSGDVTTNALAWNWLKFDMLF